ncbi:putative quinol monooxygenase [Desulfosporosinus youngiae]|uniref:ABM domain-containing protein n=1 Tax=Desulfosporosinus youngiae DSM 17734 TaxID=768710 RepID=H5XUH3_9FIRM|nr:putative quinol monooxygenase [Desulfosporosinus youngiae]EHQ89409.1 hypothetical protein DesyoDRAFT_2328 [Desulfosporosinus youngiae DSM 17734]
MITILAFMKALPGKENELAEVCALLANEVKVNEKGNFMYKVHVAAADPSEFILVEKYEDEQALEIHRNTAYLKEAKVKFQTLLAVPLQLKFLNELE